MSSDGSFGAEVEMTGEDGHVRTVGECLTLGGHDGSPCSFCGHTSRPRPPAVPKPKCCGGRWNGASIVHKDDCPRHIGRDDASVQGRSLP